MMINKHSLLLLSFLNLCGSYVNAMEVTAEDGKPVLQTCQQVRLFSSPLEMISLGQEVFVLTMAEKHDEAYSLIPQFWATSFSPISLLDYENYSFYTSFALARYHLNKAKKTVLDPKTCLEQFEMAGKVLEDYILCLGDIDSQVSPYMEHMKDHRAVVYREAGDTFYQLGSLNSNVQICHNEIEREKVSDLYKKSEKYYKLALFYLPQTRTPLPKEIIFDVQLELFNLYGNLINLANLEDKEAYLKQARRIAEDFERNRTSGANSHWQKAKKNLSFFRQLIEKDKVFARSQQTGSKKIQKMRAKKFNILQKQAYETLEQNEGSVFKQENKTLIPKVEINQYYNYLLAFCEEESAETLRFCLKNLEKRVQEILEDSGKPAGICDIYQQLQVYLGVEAFTTNFKIIMSRILIETGEIQEAVERMTILAEFERKKVGNISVMTRFLKASLKNLLSDHEEWVAFEKEMSQAVEKKKLARQKKRDNRQQQMAQLIKFHQSKAIQDQDVEKSSQSVSGHEHKNQGKTYNSHDVRHDLGFLPESLSSKQNKELKQQRHLEAERRRAEEAAEQVEIKPADSPLLNLSNSNSHKDLKDKPKELPWLRDVYDLTRGARLVDDEIENDTWQFSRDDLIHYFTCLGCEKKEGGRHKKLSFPRALIFTKDNHVVTVLNDFGGALTLPRWDQSHNSGRVPQYLRKQILAARNKLILFKLTLEARSATS